MQALAVTASDHQTARKLVDDQDLSVLHDVILVALEQRMRAQRLFDVMVQLGVVCVRKGFDVERLLRLFDALGGQHDRAMLDVDHIVAALGLFDAGKLVRLADLLDILAAFQTAHKAVRVLVHLGALLAASADDQRRSGLVDQNRVDLVDDRVMQRTLHHAFLVDAHIVAQVVKAEFIVRSVGDVRAIRIAALVRIEIVYDTADLKTEEAIDLSHPLRVAFGEVVVDRDNVHALALQRIQIRRQRCNERFALAGLHLGDTSLMQNHAAQQLHVKVPHADGAHARLAHDRKRFDQQIVERFAVFQPFSEFNRFMPQLFVRELLHFGLQRVDLRHLRLQLFQFAFARGAEQLVQKSHSSLLDRY